MTKAATATDKDPIAPLRGARAMIAEKMVSSLRDGAQLTHHGSCDASGLLARRKHLAEAGQKASVEDLINHCMVQVLQRHPEINGRITADGIQLSSSIDLCVAIALPGNLLVAPAIFGADAMNIAELRSARQDLANRARNNKLTVTEMTGGSFTVSNLGLTRVEQFTPIINAPQIAILGIGKLTDRAVRGQDGGIELRPHIGLSLTFDHRAVDGAPAANVLTDICETIEALK